MAPATVRRVVIAVCVAGVVGMIVSSVADRTGAAMTFGLVTAVAVLCLMVATAVSGPARGGHQRFEEDAARVESGVRRLVDAGADEDDVRRLVGDAIALGRARR